MNKKITGVMVYYYFVCKQKLWYFYNEIVMEQGNEDVAIGKLIDETTYKRDSKHINIDNVINIDFLRNDGVLHEIKKSRKIEQASIWQVKYYLYYLKKKGVEVSARIDYPTIKKTQDVFLEKEDEEKLEKILVEIEQICSKDVPPKFEKKRICSKCAYHDLCYI